MNTFEMKTAIHFGDNALDRLKEIPYKRVLIRGEKCIMDLQRNKEIKKDCCSKSINFSLRPYTDGSAELRCKKCGYVIREFDAPKEK